jgi:hypothetical protein
MKLLFFVKIERKKSHKISCRIHYSRVSISSTRLYVDKKLNDCRVCQNRWENDDWSICLKNENKYNVNENYFYVKKNNLNKKLNNICQVEYFQDVQWIKISWTVLISDLSKNCFIEIAINRVMRDERVLIKVCQKFYSSVNC